MRGAWIEIAFVETDNMLGAPSLPMRGAWIEIIVQNEEEPTMGVAPHAGSVD